MKKLSYLFALLVSLNFVQASDPSFLVDGVARAADEEEVHAALADASGRTEMELALGGVSVLEQAGTLRDVMSGDALLLGESTDTTARSAVDLVRRGATGLFYHYHIHPRAALDLTAAFTHAGGGDADPEVAAWNGGSVFTLAMTAEISGGLAWASVDNVAGDAAADKHATVIMALRSIMDETAVEYSLASTTAAIAAADDADAAWAAGVAAATEAAAITAGGDNDADVAVALGAYRAKFAWLRGEGLDMLSLYSVSKAMHDAAGTKAAPAGADFTVAVHVALRPTDNTIAGAFASIQ